MRAGGGAWHALPAGRFLNFLGVGDCLASAVVTSIDFLVRILLDLRRPGVTSDWTRLISLGSVSEAWAASTNGVKDDDGPCSAPA